MPNSFAYLMLLIWPVIALGLFRRMAIERALIWSILGAYLLLPPVAMFALPLLPDMDKTLIPNATSFLICAFVLHHRIGLLPESLVGKVLLLLFVFSPVATIIANQDQYPVAIYVLPGLQLTETVSATLNQMMLVMPFLLGRRFLNSELAGREIMLALMVGGIIYAVPMLAEVRLSPQINTWVYGFFQHSFAQTIRYGGFRPIVFLPHGIWAAFFSMLTVVAALALWKFTPKGSKGRGRYLLAFLGLAGVLVLCKTFGPIIYAFLLIPLVLFTRQRTQITLAALLAVVVFSYPVLRGSGLVPAEAMVARIAEISEDRALSLGFRFVNEEVLLEHARDRPLFGWGGFGRAMVYDELTGENTSVADGRWIIVLGSYGWFGYFGEFGLLALPLLLLLGQARRLGSAAIPPYAGPLALMLAVNLVDLLPNATLIPLTFLMAGAAMGLAEALRAGKPMAATAEQTASPILPLGPRTIL